MRTQTQPCAAARGITAVVLTLVALTLVQTAAADQGVAGLSAEYFDNPDLTGLVLTRTDAVVDFTWEYGSPEPRIAPDYFSVRWTGTVEPRYSELYTFHAKASDGVRLWVDGRLVIDKWRDRGITEVSGTIALAAGQRYPIRLEYYETVNRAVIQLAWSSASQTKEIVPQSRFTPGAAGAPPAPASPHVPPVAPPPAPTPTPPAPSLPPEYVPGPSVGVWASPAELRGLLMSGDPWRALLASAEKPLGAASVADQNSDHDVYTLGAALAATRTGRADLAAKATQGLLAAIGTEEGARWLAVGRNVGAYALAADVLGLRADGNPASPGTRVQAWLARFLARTLRHNNDASRQVTLRQAAWHSGSNASAQEGFVHAAIASYLGNRSELDWAWTAFRRYAGDRTSSHRISSNSDAWQAVPSDAVAIQNAGATKNGCRLSGAISNDMARGGMDVCSPGYTQYPWVGLAGAVPAALVLARAGYPAWAVADRALYRAFDYLWFLRTATGDAAWFDGRRGAQTVFLLNRAYGASFPVVLPTGAGQTVGFVDWTHGPGGAGLGVSPG